MDLLAEFHDVLERPGGASSIDEALGCIVTRYCDLWGGSAATLHAIRGTGDRRRLIAMTSFRNGRVMLHRSHARPLGSSPTIAQVVEEGRSVCEARSRRSTPRSATQGVVRRVALPLIGRAGAVVGVVVIEEPAMPATACISLAERHARAGAVVASAIERSDLLKRITDQNAQLRRQNRELRQQALRIEALRDETEEAFRTSARALAIAAELHDEQTGNHVARVAAYCTALAERTGMAASFRRELDYSAGLHDVGKMSVDAAILRKRGTLTPEERQEMKRHTVYGYRILAHSERLAMAAEIALCHHERWDGTGYPRGLRGEEIPLSARFVTLADVYDALRSPRPYKTARSHDEVRLALLGSAGFDPDLLALFAEHHRDFEEIYDNLVDQPGRRVGDEVMVEDDGQSSGGMPV